MQDSKPNCKELYKECIENYQNNEIALSLCEDRYTSRNTYVFNGVREDFKMIGAFADSGGSSVMPTGSMGGCIGVFGLVDLPFSFVVDTLLLAYTIPKAIMEDL